MKRKVSVGPVDPNERFLNLDVLRGFAIFGILLANILLFAFPSGALGIGEGSKSASTLLVSLFVEGKFYVLLCLLFGIGITLQRQRSAKSGLASVTPFYRRFLILFLFGLAHAVFLFSADILAFYALAAFAALPFVRLPARTLAIGVTGLYLVGFLFLGSYASFHPETPFPSVPAWGTMAKGSNPIGDQINGKLERATSSTVQETLFSATIARLGISEAEFYSFMAGEERIFRDGSLGQQIYHRAANHFLFITPLRVVFIGWQVVALFLLGSFLCKRTVLIDEGNSPLYRKMAIWGFVGGMGLQVAGGVSQMMLPSQRLLVPLFLFGVFGGAILLALSYASGITLISRRWGETLPVRSLAAVGRMALTNYIGHSIICGFLFYSFGLALFGRLSVPLVLSLVLPIFLLQMVASVYWLKFFRFGPLEWLWRTLTYGRILPLMNPRAEAR